MNTSPNPSSREFFENMYRTAKDPWNFERDSYELSRYDALVEALADAHFGHAFEPGCSVGVLTARLAVQCDTLLATDISEAAVRRARERCQPYRNVVIEQGSVADARPGDLDLLVLSEIGYYSKKPELREWADRLLTSVRVGGVVLAAHWLGDSADHVLSGDEVHSILGELAAHHNYTLTLRNRMNGFRVDKWTRT